jgi:hypothetical protein
MKTSLQLKFKMCLHNNDRRWILPLNLNKRVDGDYFTRELAGDPAQLGYMLVHLNL